MAPVPPASALSVSRGPWRGWQGPCAASPLVPGAGLPSCPAGLGCPDLGMRLCPSRPRRGLLALGGGVGHARPFTHGPGPPAIYRRPFMRPCGRGWRSNPSPRWLAECTNAEWRMRRRGSHLPSARRNDHANAPRPDVRRRMRTPEKRPREYDADGETRSMDWWTFCVAEGPWSFDARPLRTPHCPSQPGLAGGEAAAGCGPRVTLRLWGAVARQTQVTA